MRWFLHEWRRAGALVGAILLGAAAPSAQAGFRTRAFSRVATEPSHQQVLNSVQDGRITTGIRDADLSHSSDTGITLTAAGDALGATPGGGWARSAPQSDVCGASVALLLSPVGEMTLGRGPHANRVYASVARPNRESGAAADESGTYLLCWQDRLGRRSDRDITDMSVQIQPASITGEVIPPAPVISEPLLIPLPPALWSGLSGLIGLGAFGAVRRSRGRRW
jgi:hypothetical protein